MEMEYRTLGNSGIKISKFGLGSWATYGEVVKDQKMVKEIVETANQAGINFFDMADAYANGDAERMMGKVLQQFPRHTLVLSSKTFFPMSDDVNDKGLSRKHIMESVEKSLQRIGADYLDIYFCHRFDKETPVEETVRAMDDLIHQGKILYWGTSEWSSEQLEQVHAIADKRNLYAPQVEQPMYNLLKRQRFEQDVKPAISKYGMGVVTFSLLASGFLTGKYDDSIPANSRMSWLDSMKDWFYSDENVSLSKNFKKVADKTGYTRSQLAIAWVAAQPAISSVILGATKVQQLKENLKALEIDISEENDAELKKLFKI